MKETKKNGLQVLVNAAQPWALLAGVGVYALGVGIADFLGRDISWNVYFLGQGVATLLQLAAYFLNAYFEELEQPAGSDRQRQQQQILHARVLLQAALSILAVGAVLTVLLFSSGAFNPTALVLLGTAFVLAFFYAVPPVRLANHGYGELAEAVLIGTLIPALGYVFQVGELHRLLAMLAFPLTALYLAMKLYLSLEHYSLRSRAPETMMERLGWQPGMNLANILALSSYLLIGVAALLGLPWPLTWPALLSLPVAGFLVFVMVQVASGAPPRWRLIRILAVGLFAITAYALAFALWTG